jgi:hypothetical protein
MDREQLFGLNDFNTLPVMQDLAWVYRRRRRYVDEETLFKRVLGLSHPYPPDSINLLAWVYEQLGRLDLDDVEMLRRRTPPS